MKPPKPGRREPGTAPFTTQTQLKDVFQVERLLNRLSQHDPAKDQLQRVELSPLAKELAQGRSIARAQPPKDKSTPKQNLPKADFIAFQREVAANQLTGEGSPLPPQTIPKITGGFRSETEAFSPVAVAAAPKEDSLTPAAPQAAPMQDAVEPIFGPADRDFDPFL